MRVHAMEELLEAQPAIRAFSLEQMTAASFRKRNNVLARKGSRAAFLSAFAGRFARYGMFLLLVATLACRFVFFPDGKIMVLTVTALALLLFLLLHSLAALAQYLPVLNAGKTAYAKLRQIVDDTDAVLDVEGARRLPVMRNEIVLSDVTVALHNELPADPEDGDSPPQTRGEPALLSGINARIGQGSHVAFAGGAAAGKTTLLNLLMRFRDPSSGVVFVDAIDVRAVTQMSLRAQIGAVQQEGFIFNATVRENILLGRSDASEEALADSAKAAGLYDLVASLPRGFDTRVGTGTARLNAAMTQRLALARAIIRNPAILILDDVMGSVSPAEETGMLKTLRQLARGRTLVSASRRLSSIKDADEIYVLDGGRIVEQGRHADLLERGGVYAAMWRKQSGFRFPVDSAHVEVDAPRLKLVPVLSALSEAELAGLAHRFGTETFGAGQEIVRRDDPAGKLFILVRGNAERWRTETEPLAMEEGDSLGRKLWNPARRSSRR